MDKISIHFSNKLGEKDSLESIGDLFLKIGRKSFGYESAKLIDNTTIIKKISCSVKHIFLFLLLLPLTSLASLAGLVLIALSHSQRMKFDQLQAIVKETLQPSEQIQSETPSSTTETPAHKAEASNPKAEASCPETEASHLNNDASISATNNQISSNNSIGESTPEKSKPIYTAHIGLRIKDGGYVGEGKERLLDDELSGWKLENGNDVPSESNELLMHFSIFHPSDNFKKVCNNSQLLLPASLFEGKNEGDVIHLRYQDQLLDLIIDQIELCRSEPPRFKKNKQLEQESDISKQNCFKDRFETTKINLLKAIERGDYGFSGSCWASPERPKEGYTLEHGGVLYSYDKSSHPRSVQKAAVQMLKPTGDVSIGEDLFRHTNNKTNGLALSFPFCGIRNSVDIILNEKFLCFYAKDTSRYGPHSRVNEYLYILKWRTIYDISFKEMEAVIANAECELDGSGYFIVKLEMAGGLIEDGSA